MPYYAALDQHFSSTCIYKASSADPAAPFQLARALLLTALAKRYGLGAVGDGMYCALRLSGRTAAAQALEQRNGHPMMSS